jgi:hypothetical protein
MIDLNRQVKLRPTDETGEFSSDYFGESSMMLTECLAYHFISMIANNRKMCFPLEQTF